MPTVLVCFVVVILPAYIELDHHRLYKRHDFVYYIHQNPVLRSEKDWHKHTALTLAIKLIKKE